jgi:Flp pilus assembly CpaE family ATPase
MEDTMPRSHTNGTLSGSVFSFLPANGASKAGAVAQQLSRTLTEGFGIAVLLASFDTRTRSKFSPPMETPRRLDGRSWTAFVSKFDGEADEIDVLDACDAHPRQLRPVLENVRGSYGIVCADLTGAKPAHVLETLRASDAIFLAGSCDPASLEALEEKIDWLRSVDLDRNCCLLLERSRNSREIEEVEELTGLPVCSLVENDRQVEQLAAWLAANFRAQRQELPRFALAG